MKVSISDNVGGRRVYIETDQVFEEEDFERFLKNASRWLSLAQLKTGDVGTGAIESNSGEVIKVDSIKFSANSRYSIRGAQFQKFGVSGYPETLTQDVKDAMKVVGAYTKDAEGWLVLSGISLMASVIVINGKKKVGKLWQVISASGT